MSRFTLHQGDSREVLKGLADSSVDAVVCDPPYHLTTGKKGGSGPASVNLESPYGRARVTTGFMGMTWDGGEVAHDPALWAECLRVAKPGAYLLAFGGTRTFHRLACAIEDAGWELRDTDVRGHTPRPEDCPWLHGWMFASGFPKSHNLDTLRGDLICGCEALPEHDVRPLREADLSAAGPRVEERREVLQQGLSKQGVPHAMLWAEPEEGLAGRLESCLEGRGDGLQKEGQLQGHSLPARAGMDEADGAQGRLHHGAPDGDGRVVRLPVDADGSGASRQPRRNAERPDESGIVAGQPEPQAGGTWPVCGRCGKPILPTGLGTALKPAWEPIVCARKPFTGTVAANVLQYGTGALNIEECRIAVDDDAYARNCSGDRGHDGTRSIEERGSTDMRMGGGLAAAGRWPANLIHDGSDEVVALFPREAGAAAPVTVRNGDKFHGTYGAFAGNVDENGSTFQGDSGSAARFFYCAKASQEDREEGISGTKRLFGMSGAAAAAAARGEHCDNGDGGVNKTTLRHNFHPTVKPTDLMRYLCRLITPKDGTILDPFMGSGSTGKAAMLEGFNFIGVDLSAEYIEIARARIDFALRQGHQPSLELA